MVFHRLQFDKERVSLLEDVIEYIEKTCNMMRTKWKHDIFLRAILKTKSFRWVVKVKIQHLKKYIHVCWICGLFKFIFFWSRSRTWNIRDPLAWSTWHVGPGIHIVRMMNWEWKTHLKLDDIFSHHCEVPKGQVNEKTNVDPTHVHSCFACLRKLLTP